MPSGGMSGPSRVRSHAAYSSKWVAPVKTLRLPIMWTTTNAVNTRPVTAMTVLAAQVGNAGGLRAEVTAGSWADGR